MKELWFKCFQIYRLSRDVELNAEEMQSQLERFIFSPCGSQDMAKTGWVSPMGSFGGGQLVHSTGSQQILIYAKKKEKNLPASVIKQELQAKVAQLESEQSRKLKKTEKDSLKDDVLHTLLPHAFSRYSQTLVWIDAVNGLIMVAAGHAQAARGESGENGGPGAGGQSGPSPGSPVRQPVPEPAPDDGGHAENSAGAAQQANG